MFEARSVIELIKELREKNVPEADYKIYIDRFLENKARRQGIPLTGSFELTPFCNLDCKMCYVHLYKMQYRGELLGVETWNDLIKQAYDAGMRNASLTGGECLTYPGFDDVYLFLYKLGVIPSILTNGVFIDEQCKSLFKRYPPKMIQVTVYGSSEEAYERVTGYRVFQKVYNNIVSLREKQIPVKMSITPNQFMRDDIKPLLNLLHSMKIPYNINANLIPPRKNTGRITHDLTIDEYIDIFNYNNKLSHQELDTVELSELPDEGHSGKKRYGFICGAGRSSFGIKYDGELCPCLSMDEISVSALDLGFQEAWKQINMAAHDYPMPEECGECVYLDRCLPCAAMHKNAPIHGHCDPRICERTKKFTSAGYIPVPEKNVGKRNE